MSIADEDTGHLVFVSHSGEDTWVAQQIADKVCQCGATSFLAEADVDVGDDFERRIHSALQQASELLVLFTPWARKRSYVQTELGVAWYRRIPITVVLHGLGRKKFLAQPNIQIYLKEKNIIRLNDVETYFQQLVTRTDVGRSND